MNQISPNLHTLTSSAAAALHVLAYASSLTRHGSKEQPPSPGWRRLQAPPLCRATQIADMSYRGAKKSPDQYATSTNISDSGTPLMAVAIDRDKNSQHAVRWAVENLRFKEKKVILVHVCSKQSLRSRRYSFLCMHATNYNNVLSFIHNTQYLIKCCVYLAMCQYVHII